MRNVFCLVIVLSGCGETMVEPPPAPSVAVLGAGNHTIAGVEIVVLADESGVLDTPRDLGLDPSEPNTLYLVNRNTSVVRIDDLGGAAQRSELLAGPGSNHFLAHPSAIAFGAPGTFATAPEEDQETQPGDPLDFMGPSLWTTDRAIFNAGTASHLDMLHNSPNAAGIAWEGGNAYWVFDGMHAALTRYDFAEDHGPAGVDHSDGIVTRHVEGQVAYRPRVPSHMEWVDGLLYVADTGNNRVAVLDPTTAAFAHPIGPNYDSSIQSAMTGSTLTTLIAGATIERMTAPSGLAIDGDILFVGDNESARIWGFDRVTGGLIDWLDLDAMIAPGGLMGIEVDANGRLLVVDARGNRLLRIAPLMPPLEP